MSKFLTEIPTFRTIQWKHETDVLDRFISEVLVTLKDGVNALWYPITAYNTRMIQAARRRLSQSGCYFIARTDLDSEGFVVMAALAQATQRRAWASEQARRARAGKVIQMATTRRKRRKAA